MSDIDPEKLAQHIAWFREHWVGRNLVGFPPGTIEVLTEIADAADRHLATLPRFKEVEVVQWAACDEHDVFQCFDREEDAREYAGTDPNGLVVIRLTGTAKVKVTP